MFIISDDRNSIRRHAYITGAGNIGKNKQGGAPKFGKDQLILVLQGWLINKFDLLIEVSQYLK